jgi:nucleotide-binding universal stress UspA family protein
MIRNILLATDGSAPSGRAADLATSLALRYRSKVTVLHAYAPALTASGRSYFAAAACGTLNEAQSLTDQIASQLRNMGVADVETDVIEGPAVDVILGASEDHQADLIVIGARGRGDWKGVALGSVSMAVIQRADCAVMVVK